ncbi:TadE/TadG family type IV pilus assembly protein [Silvibacterium dinghuense]|nr:TadE/TadG family type IV pilus assembly protein [Silvibacterium dinghuense]GGH06226.1 hypothetical protein GCM10011586_23040 [Silvibacterium dinghuense]
MAVRTPLQPSFRSLWMEETGSELVEFTITLSLVLMTIFSILAGSVALYAQHYVTNAAREATRYAIVRGSYWSGTTCSTTTAGDCMATSTNVSNFVLSTVPPLISTSQLSVSTSWPGTTATGAACDTINGTNSITCTVSVTVSYNYNFLLPFLPDKTITLASTSSGTIAE